MRRETKPSGRAPTAMSRREALRVSAVGFASLPFAGCGPGNVSTSSRREDPIGALDSSLPLREYPVEIPVFAVSCDEISPSSLAETARVLLPFKSYSPVPIVIVYHALRFWGPNARFADLEYLHEDLRGQWSKQMLAILTDDRAYQRFSKRKLAHLLVPSPFGVKVLSVSDTEWGRSTGSTHPGAYVQIMAEVGVSARTPLALADGRVRCVGDAIKDEARRTHLRGESEWLVAGLSRYLCVSRWQNRFKQWVSFDELAALLCKRPFGQGACFGCHVPYALAVVLGVHSRKPLLSPACADLVRSRLRELSRQLVGMQDVDGSWPPLWAASRARQPSVASSFGSVLVDTVCVTGHHLEWMVHCEPDLRPPATVLRLAAEYLSRTVSRLRPLIAADWHAYLPLSHAGRALHLASGRRWPNSSSSCSR